VALGGAQEIVRQHLDRVMQQFDEGELDVLADAFGHLVTPSGSKIAHRASDLAEFSGHDPARMRALLRRLAEGDQRILRDVPPPMDQPHAEPRYEIFHDVLALAVLDWRRRYLAEAEARRQQVALIADNMRAEQEAKEAKRRLRRARSVVAGMGLLLLAGVALAIWALASRNTAQQAKAEAVSSREETALNGVYSDVNRLLQTDPSAALIRAQDLALDDDHDPTRRFQDAYRQALDAADTEVVLDLGSPVVIATPTADHDLVTVTEDRHVRLWHVESMDPVRLSPKPLIDASVPGETSERIVDAVTVDGGQFAVVRTDAGEVSSVDLSSGDVQKLDIHLGTDSAIAASDDGSGDIVVAYNYKKKATLWHVADNTTSDLPGLKQSLSSAAIDSTDEYLALTVFRDGKVFQQVWSVSSSRRLGEIEVTSHTGQTIYYASASFTGRDPELLILGTGYQTEAALWRYWDNALTPLGDESEHWRQAYDSEDVYDASAAKDGEKFDGLMAIAGDKAVSLFDAVGDERGKRRTTTLAGHDWVTAVERNPADTREFAVASRDGYVELYRLLDLVPPHPIWTFRGHQGVITDVSWLYDDNDPGKAQERLVTASRDGTVRIWRHPASSYDWYVGDWILGVEYTANGDWLVGLMPFRVARSDGQHAVGHVAKVLHDEVLDETYGQAIDMSASPDGEQAVVVDQYCGVPIVQPLTMDDPQVLLNPPTGSASACINAVAWNPDPNRHQIVAGSAGNTLVAWDTDSGKVTGSLRLGNTASDITDVAISEDGATIVAVSQTAAAGMIHVINADDLTLIDEWPAHDLDFVDISRDGRYIATSGNDRRLVQVWDAHHHDAPLQVLGQASVTLSHVALSPDDSASRVAVTTSTGDVYVWERSSGRLLSVEKVHADAANQVVFNPKNIDQMVSAGDDGEMIRSLCELCSVDTVAGLHDIAKDRMAQTITLTD
jgi:WD40 repeat protein